MCKKFEQEDQTEFYQNCSLLFFPLFFFTVQLKIQIFFHCLHWRLFCSAPLHRCLGFVPGTELMHFMLNSTVLDCSGREGEKKSSFSGRGVAGNRWDLWEQRLGFANLWASHPSVSVWPHTCAWALCQGGRCTDPESHPGFGATPVSHTGLICLHSCRCLYRTDTNAFTPKTRRESRGAEYPICPPGLFPGLVWESTASWCGDTTLWWQPPMQSW